MTVFLMHVAAANCCLWIRITVGEAQERENKLTGRCKQTTFSTVCVHNYTVTGSYNIQDLDSGSSHPQTLHEELRETADKSAPFLYPCIAEFCLSASDLLLKLWLNQEPQSADQAADNGNEDNNDDSGDDRQRLIHNPNRLQKKTKQSPLPLCCSLCCHLLSPYPRYYNLANCE